jgi:hypothetical protein
VGGGAAAVMGGVFGAIMAYGKSAVARLRQWLRALSGSHKD